MDGNTIGNRWALNRRKIRRINRLEASQLEDRGDRSGRVGPGGRGVQIGHRAESHRTCLSWPGRRDPGVVTRARRGVHVGAGRLAEERAHGRADDI